MNPTAHPTAARILALTAILLTAFNMRAAVTALSPLVPRLTGQLGVTGTQLGLLGMIPTAMFALSAIVSPRILRVLTVPQSLAAAMALTAAGQLVRVTGPSIPALFLGSIFALFAIGLSNALLPLAVRAFFPHRVAALSMIYLVIMQIGMAIAPLAAEPLAQAAENSHPGHGWQYSLGAWALPAAVALLVWLPLLRTPRSRVAAKAAGPAPVLPVWRTPIGVGLAVMFGFTSFATYTMMLFLPQMYIDGGASASFAALMLSVWSAIGLLLAFIGPWLVSRFNDPYLPMMAFVVLFVIGNVGIAFTPMSAPWLWVVLSAVGPCAFPMGLTLINVRARTMEGATGLSSFGQGAGYALACGGPVIVGILHEHAEGWFWPAITTTIALGFVAIGGFFATRPTTVEDQLAARRARS